MSSGTFVTEWLHKRGGIAHTSEAKAHGFSERAIAAAVAAGVQRVRRSWLVQGDADPDLVFAVTAGGRLTCVSEAKRRKLWVPLHSGLHVAVKPTASRLFPVLDAEAGATVAETVRDDVVHWSHGPMPVARFAVADAIVNVLFHIARCLPREDAVTVWESALRKGLVSLEELRRVKWGSSRAAEVLAAASVLSDSGLETLFRVRMKACGVAVRQQVWIDGHPVDGLIGERLVVQIDGFAHHSDAAARRRDIAADARLTLRGYTVLRFDWKQILFDWLFVEQTMLMAVAQRLHLAR
jgi:very-short-patch-repair endonuclease